MGLIFAVTGALAISVLFNKKIEETLAPAFMMIMLVIYLPGLWFKLTGGFVIALLICGCGLIYVMFKLVTGKTELKGLLLSWGGLALLIYAGFFAYFSLHRDFAHPDELYCWGLMAKNYYYYDLINSPLSTALATDQTPILPLLDYFFAKSVGSFSDGNCYFAHNMFAMSLLTAFFSNIKSRLTPLKFFLITVMLPSLLVLSGLDAFKVILGDMIIAALLCFFGMNIMRFCESGDHYYYFAAMMSLACMCLTKRLGPVFASVAIFIIVPILMKRSSTYIRELSGLMAAVALVTLSWFGISVYVIVPFFALAGGLLLYAVFGWINSLQDRFGSLIRVLFVLGALGCIFGYMILVLGKDGYSYAVMARYMKDQFYISTENNYVCLSYGLFMLISFGMNIAINYCMDKGIWTGDKETGAMLSTAFGWSGMALLLYGLFMLTMHIWQIGPMNNNIEGIIPRYLIPWEIFVVFLIIYALYAVADDIKIPVLFAGMVILICISDTGDFYGQLFSKHQCIGYTALSDAGIELKPEDMIYFIDEDEYFSYSDREFYYRMWPARTNFIDQIFMGNNGRITMDADELASMLASDQYLNIPYNYLYLQTCDEDFADRYGSLFEDPEDIAPGRVYDVNITEGRVLLKLITDR